LRGEDHDERNEGERTDDPRQVVCRDRPRSWTARGTSPWGACGTCRRPAFMTELRARRKRPAAIRTRRFPNDGATLGTEASRSRGST
jgi:hypothetical protein